MAEIVLTTLNARYWHSSFGLRYLKANMGELADATALIEFTINDRLIDIVAAIRSHQPKIIGLGIYIWNIDQTTQLVRDLRAACPRAVIVIGGPEVSYEYEQLPIVEDADYLITGEADLEFAQLCRRLLHQDKTEATQLPVLNESKVIPGTISTLDQVRMPYELYSDEDIAHRVIYVEISRGCPFTCEFCLSALEIPVRLFGEEEFLQAMQDLLDRGVRQFKFVDRTFNLNLRVSAAVLRFFLERMTDGLFLHFEMIPDRLPAPLRELIAEFPPGVLQFEIGVQTFNAAVGELISRRQDNNQLEDNFRFLREQTGVHIHADLIVGLPGETLSSFAEGFDRLVRLNPHEIQVGMLKRLRGTPITRHDENWEMNYSRNAPYEILSNRLLDFETVHRMRRFARYWDVFANSGNFVRTIPLLWESGSPFDRFDGFCEWLYQVEQRTHTIPLKMQVTRLFEYLTAELSLAEDRVAAVLLEDYQRGGRRDIPDVLRAWYDRTSDVRKTRQSLPRRQQRHLRE